MYYVFLSAVVVCCVLFTDISEESVADLLTDHGQNNCSAPEQEKIKHFYAQIVIKKPTKKHT